MVEVSASGFAPSGAAGAAVLSPQRGTGSGVLVTADGYVVTNAHVVEGARSVQVLLRGREAGAGGSILPPPGEPVGAVLVGADRETDLAVLRIDRQSLPFVEMGDSDALRAGDLVLAFGSPMGLDQSVTLGVVSAPARQLAPEAPMIYVQTDASINPGNSGGPLCDLDGKVMGINSMIVSTGQGIGFAIPINLAKRRWPSTYCYSFIAIQKAVG